MAVQLPPWVRSLLGIHRLFDNNGVELPTTSDVQILGTGAAMAYNSQTGRVELTLGQSDLWPTVQSAATSGVEGDTSNIVSFAPPSDRIIEISGCAIGVNEARDGVLVWKGNTTYETLASDTPSEESGAYQELKVLRIGTASGWDLPEFDVVANSIVIVAGTAGEVIHWTGFLEILLSDEIPEAP